MKSLLVAGFCFSGITIADQLQKAVFHFTFFFS
jgi:hypothetical protein